MTKSRALCREQSRLNAAVAFAESDLGALARRAGRPHPPKDLKEQIRQAREKIALTRRIAIDHPTDCETCAKEIQHA